METALLRYCFNFSSHPHHKKISAHHRVDGETQRDERCATALSRRSVLASGFSLVSSTALVFPGDGLAVVKQGLLAGRVPGLSEPDDEGSFHSVLDSYMILSCSVSYPYTLSSS